MKTKVIVYTGPNCGDCVQSKNLLNQRNIEFEEKPIAEGTNLNEMLTLSGFFSKLSVFFWRKHIKQLERKRRVSGINWPNS